MKTMSDRAVVNTTSTPILVFEPRMLHSVVIKATAAMEIGFGGVQSDKGLALGAGESIAFSHWDFDNPGPGLVRIDAVAAVATTAQIFMFTR